MQIKFNEVDFTYNENTPYENKVLKKINLKIFPYSFTVIIGKTGSGKSTLIEHINGLLLPDKGFVLIEKKRLEKKRTKKEKKLLQENLLQIRKNIAMLFQFSEQQLFESTVLRDIIYAPLNYGVSEKDAIARAKHLINVVGLDESYLKRSPFELSGGEMRKVALCGVLAIKPKILVLDEPTIGLDYKSKKDFMDLIYKIHKKEKMTVVFITHNMEYVLKYADNIIIMEDGKIKENIKDKDYFIKIIKENKYNLEAPDIIKLQLELLNKGFPLSRVHFEYEKLFDEIKERFKVSYE